MPSLLGRLVVGLGQEWTSRTSRRGSATARSHTSSRDRRWCQRASRGWSARAGTGSASRSFTSSPSKDLQPSFRTRRNRALWSGFRRALAALLGPGFIRRFSSSRSSQAGTPLIARCPEVPPGNLTDNGWNRVVDCEFRPILPGLGVFPPCQGLERFLPLRIKVLVLMTHNNDVPTPVPTEKRTVGLGSSSSPGYLNP